MILVKNNSFIEKYLIEFEYRFVLPRDFIRFTANFELNNFSPVEKLLNKNIQVISY